MKQLLLLLKRLFVTNWKTTVGALSIIIGMGLWIHKDITTEQYLVLIPTASAWIGLTAKDGVRDEKVVAPENTDIPGQDAA